MYAANEDAPEHAVARRYLDQLLQEGAPCGIPWGVVYEFLASTTRLSPSKMALTSDEAQRFIQALFEQSTFQLIGPTERHASLLNLTLKELHQPKGNFFHDIETAVVLREHGISEIITGDTDFLKFPFLKVINPFHTPPEPRVGESRVRYRRRKTLLPAS